MSECLNLWFQYCSAQDSVSIMESASELLYLWTKDEEGEEKISEFVQDLMKIYTFMIEPYQRGTLLFFAVRDIITEP